jgi:nitrate reductase beta subunit
MSPVMSMRKGDVLTQSDQGLFHEIDNARVPMQYLAKLFGAGHDAKVRYALKKQMAIRSYRRAVTVGDIEPHVANQMLREADCTPAEAEAIYKLTSLCTFEERFVIPPMHREEALEMMEDPMDHKRETGFGLVGKPQRGS